MKYFSQFPTIQSNDGVGNDITLVNILLRTEIIPSLLNDSQVFYAYDIQDGDTPDIIASKYYSNSDRYWEVMYSGGIFDPQSDWPMHSNLFNDYIVDKYAPLVTFSLIGDLLDGLTGGDLLYAAENVVDLLLDASPALLETVGQEVLQYTQSAIQHYIKNVTTTDSSTNSSNTISYVIDQYAYENTLQGTRTVFFNTGAYSTITTEAYPQSIYDYEMQINENKRRINLLNVTYAGALEKQLTNLLR